VGELCEKEGVDLGTQCDRASLYLLTGVTSMLWLYMMFHFVRQLIETGKYVLFILVWLTVLAIWTYIWLSSIMALRDLEGFSGAGRTRQ